MEVIKFSADGAQIELNHSEVLVLNSALNEICNGIDLFEFDTRIGSSHDQAKCVLEKFGQLLDEMEKLDAST